MRAVVGLMLFVWVGACGGSNDQRLDGAAADVAQSADGEGAGPGGRRMGGGALPGTEVDAASDHAVDGVFVAEAGPEAGAGDRPGSSPDADAPPAPAPDAGNDLPAVETAFEAPRAEASAEAPTSMCNAGGVCDDLEAEYAAALARAQMCNPLLKLQCQQQAPGSLACGGCPVWVRDTSELEEVRKKWEGAGCSRCVRACPAILCRLLNEGTCVSRLGATTGTCEDRGIIIAPL